MKMKPFSTHPSSTLGTPRGLLGNSGLNFHDGAFYGLSFGPHGGIIGTGVCDCRLFEPGFDDDPSASGTQFALPAFTIAAYHGIWRADGMPWRGKGNPQPLGWSAALQLDHLRKTAPHLSGIIETDAWDMVRAQVAVQPVKQQ
jgi:hypothetical protein